MKEEKRKTQAFSRHLVSKAASEHLSNFNKLLAEMMASSEGKPEALQDIVVVEVGQANFPGIISAAFFREKTYRVQQPTPKPLVAPPILPGNSPATSRERPEAGAAGAAGLQSQRDEARIAPSVPPAEYAATGIGDRVRHDVQWIHMDLEDLPFATVNLRYEFRPGLARLGVIPPPVSEDPLIRREKARGFRDAVYCPEP
jgi:hypothetical protein